MSVFSDYSVYYDLLYRDKDYAAEVEYLHKIIQQEFPGAKTILNLGCGTGMHDLLLAEKGYSITAIDLSDTMIDIAIEQNTYPDKISFSVGDIRDLDLDQKFDVVVSLFHVMSYQTSDSDLKKAMNTAGKHLAENGVFLFDYWYGPGVLSDPPHKREKCVENENLKIHRHTTPNWIKDKHIVEVVFDIDIHDKKTGASYKVKETHPMRYLFEEDIDKALLDTDLNKVAAYKWMTEQKPSEDDWYVIDIIK